MRTVPVRDGGAGLAGLASAAALAGQRAGVELALALIALVIGAIPYGIGQALWSLLDDAPSGSGSDDEPPRRERGQTGHMNPKGAG